jgi:hypothetical protein
MAAMGRLRSWKRELFARAIAENVEIKKAYVDAGFKPSSIKFRNYNRLLREPDVIARINEFAKEREERARAARVPIDEVLAKLDARNPALLFRFDRTCSKSRSRYRWHSCAS